MPVLLCLPANASFHHWPSTSASCVQDSDAPPADSASWLRDSAIKTKRDGVRARLQQHLAERTYSSLDGSELPESAEAKAWKASLAEHKRGIWSAHGALMHAQPCLKFASCCESTALSATVSDHGKAMMHRIWSCAAGICACVRTRWHSSILARCCWPRTGALSAALRVLDVRIHAMNTASYKV